MAATEPWNRLHIPRPAIQSLITIPRGADTDNHVKDVIAGCVTVKSLLSNKALDAEKAALNSILYVYHHRLSYHKPYLALKQVEQCIKRLTVMDLEGSIQEMLDLCPKYIGVNESHCSVPSQPIMELASVKMLGACKLMLRLMDCCCKAFHLCLQHLHLEEFIVLNVVLLGLLSRLWVMYRGILLALIDLFEVQYALQQEVSHFQKMPYIKDFDFPPKIEDYLGPELLDIIKRELPQISVKKAPRQLLNKMFASHGINKKEKKVKIQVKLQRAELPERKSDTVDLGRPIERHRTNRGRSGTFDVKSMQRPAQSDVLKPLISKPKHNLSKKSQPLLCHKPKNKYTAHLVSRVQQAECFRELSEQIQKAIKWCKRRKLMEEAVFFRNKSLRVNRLKYVESLGHSLKKKLRHMKKCICQSLHQGILKINYHKPCLRQQTWKARATVSRMNSRRNNGKHDTIYSGDCKYKAERTQLKKSALRKDQDPGDQVLSLADIPSLTSSESRNNELTLPINVRADKVTQMTTDENDNDIDDIFLSIGV
ncbi:nucleolus and neural progenitor protein isoform 1-T2 [Discoglossus pictus]